MYSQRKNDLKPLDWIVDRTKIAHDKRRAEYIKHATYIFNRLSKQMIVRCVWACKYISVVILPLENFINSIMKFIYHSVISYQTITF